MQFIVPCYRCGHYSGKAKCKAFPQGIPDLILSGEDQHTEPFPGDGGIQFEPKEEEN